MNEDRVKKETSDSIYHTNVIMCIAIDFVLVGFDIISDLGRREEIRAGIADMGRNIIDMDNCQISEFAGNAIEFPIVKGHILAISASAAAALTEMQKVIIELSAKIVELSAPTI